VQAGQVQHSQLDAGGSDQVVELVIEAGEALAVGLDFQLVEGLLHGGGGLLGKQ
jgi:hypothetical protein